MRSADRRRRSILAKASSPVEARGNALPSSGTSTFGSHRPAASLSSSQTKTRGKQVADDGLDDLWMKAYQELRRLARAYMRRERPGQTLQATALVHEAFLKLMESEPAWTDWRHFVGIAARAMRQIRSA